MDTFKGGHQIILSGQGSVTCITCLKIDPLRHTVDLSIFNRALDGGFVKIETVHLNFGITLGHADTRPASTAADIGHARRRICLETRVQVWDRGQPFFWQLMGKGRTVYRRLSLTKIAAIDAIRHTTTTAKGV